MPVFKASKLAENGRLWRKIRVFSVCFWQPLRVPFHSKDGPVKIYSPAEPGKPWRVTWSPPGMTRQVKDRQDEKGALALAQEIKG